MAKLCIVARQVTCLVLATADGQALAHELAGTSSSIHTSKVPPRVTPALQDIGDATIMDHWIQAICSSPHLLPLNEHVHVLCNQVKCEVHTSALPLLPS